jgi:hypothetical protein
MSRHNDITTINAVTALLSVAAYRHMPVTSRCSKLQHVSRGRRIHVDMDKCMGCAPTDSSWRLLMISQTSPTMNFL